MNESEMKHLIKRYEEALRLIEEHSGEFFVTNVARAALGKDSNFQVVEPFNKGV